MTSFEKEWEPLEYRVLVRLPDVEEKTAGGIILIEETKVQEGMAQVYGTMVKMSDMAFTNGDGRKWSCSVPVAGDEVMFAKYAGLKKLIEEDGVQVEYRIMNDKDIVAVKKGKADG